MKLSFLAAFTILVPLASFAHEPSQNASPTKVAELTAHRIERLVTLGKIDKTFASNFESLEVSAAGPAPIAFRSLVSQTKPAVGKPLQLELFFDAAAKPVSFNVLTGGAAGPSVAWTGLDPVSLLENSLHEVLENEADAKIGPFFTGLQTVTLTKEVLNGMDVSRAQITSDDTASKLNVYLMLDGSFMVNEIVP